LLLVDLMTEETRKLCGVEPEIDQVKKIFNNNSDKFQSLPQNYLPKARQKTNNSYYSDIKRQTKKKSRQGEKITQKELIPYILQSIKNHGGRARNKVVKEDIYNKLKHIFEQSWYQETVTDLNVPRWGHHIDWARNLAKDRGYIKKPERGDRGFWEISDLGRKYLDSR